MGQDLINLEVNDQGQKIGECLIKLDKPNGSTLVKSDHYAYRIYHGVPHQEYPTQDTFWQAHHSIYYRAVEGMDVEIPRAHNVLKEGTVLPCATHV
ncbi:hypothetical protein SI65_09348 [Aspergillus cristatus]|uniref:Uncharacterized protein n=1 Tax=Aspergillus cristatus TaxID=573508 RepID=A0A1E3B2G0_ASPCR|nr:hypothetical protein SI65_09348 [Aspergillus cristatus]